MLNSSMHMVSSAISITTSTVPTHTLRFGIRLNYSFVIHEKGRDGRVRPISGRWRKVFKSARISLLRLWNIVD